MQNVYQTKYGKAASRRRILNWINNNLRTSFMRIEDLRSGVEYCLMLHKLKPSAIKLKQVFMNPRTHYEYVHNMRLLQKSLFKQGVEKQIPIQRLVSRGNLENLEFAQWFKAFYDLNYKLLRDEKLLRDDQYSVIDVMKTGVKPQAKFDEMPESFVDTEQSRNESRYEPGIFLDVEDPSISRTHKIDVTDEEPGNEPDLFRSPQSISTQILDDLSSSFDNLSDKEQDSLGPELHYSSSADEWSLNSDEGCTTDRNPKSISTQIVKDSDDVPLSHNLETFSANAEDQSIHKAEMGKQAIMADDLGSDFDRASDKEQFSLGPELYYSSADEELSLRSLEECTTDRCFSYNNLNSLFRNPESISTQIVEDFGAGLTTKSVPLDDDAPVFFNLETISANEKELGEQFTLRHDILKAETDKQTKPADDLSSSFDNLSDQEQFSLGPELHYSSSADEWSLKSDEGYSSTLFQNELETDMPIPFAIVRSKSQSSHENISENTIPINVIDFQKYRNPSNICNSANSSTTDELSQKKMDPKRCGHQDNVALYLWLICVPFKDGRK
ncbi:uncharacterized protein Dere_GG24985 [Drosophila erecta]|uniref:Calponin-homology (CH) domain-containing protein n=1 Tax=Drosophila erecta TaxID=7220 RepID=B3N3P2_DROER|nr:uncharacterized protein Dere_GG24985 [Drosophila erecta]